MTPSCRIAATVLQRSILDFLGRELSHAKASLTEQQREAADLAAENERRGLDIEDNHDAAVALQANRATLQGRQGRVAAEQRAAVLGAKLEAATIEALAQARKHGEAVFADAAEVEAAKDTVANLTGKLEAMQAQIHRHADELDATRQNASELSGKPATKLPKAPSTE